MRDQNPVSTRLSDKNDVNLICEIEIDNLEQVQENSTESDFENKNETENKNKKCENCKKYKNTDNDINYNFSEHLNKNDSKLTIMMNNPFRTKKIFKKDHQSSIKKIIDGDNHLFSVTPLKSSVKNHGPSASLSVAVIEDERRNSVITSDSGNDSNFELSEHSWSQNSIRGIKNTTTTQKIRITNIKSSSETLRRKKYNTIKNNFFSSRPTAKNILKSKSLAIEFNKVSENSAVSNNFVSDFSETKTNLANSLIPENTEENQLQKPIAEKAKVQSRPVSLKRNRPLVDMESLKTWRNHFHASGDDKKEHHKTTSRKKHKIELPIFSKRYRKFKRNLNSIENDNGDKNNNAKNISAKLIEDLALKRIKSYDDIDSIFETDSIGTLFKKSHQNRSKMRKSKDFLSQKNSFGSLKSSKSRDDLMNISSEGLLDQILEIRGVLHAECEIQFFIFYIFLHIFR